MTTDANDKWGWFYKYNVDHDIWFIHSPNNIRVEWVASLQAAEAAVDALNLLQDLGLINERWFVTEST